jgi:CMP-N-acetylneuraminic acid synthetase
MIGDQEILAIIPARGGSKGLPGKNLRLLNGKPLIAYSILAARGSSRISRCIVSTEDPDIKNVSLQWGSEVIDRPIDLACDFSPSQDVVRHVLEKLRSENSLPEFFALLQPTSPLRNAVHLQSCIDAFLNSDCLCAISVTEANDHPYKFFRCEENMLLPIFDVESLSKPRQLLPVTYRLNGAIFIMRSKLFLEKNTFFTPPAMPFFMRREESVDIDTEHDLMIASIFLEKRRSSQEQESM